jgi:hypothetical protein
VVAPDDTGDHVEFGHLYEWRMPVGVSRVDESRHGKEVLPAFR